jgi:hypothetical protein
MVRQDTYVSSVFGCANLLVVHAGGEDGGLDEDHVDIAGYEALGVRELVLSQDVGVRLVTVRPVQHSSDCEVSEAGAEVPKAYQVLPSIG